MPQFILNTPPSRADAQRAVAYGYLKPAKRRAVHPFNDLDEFAQGYVEAMFFTNGDIGDETRPDRLNEMGVSRLTRASVDKIEADCDRFQRSLSDTGKALRAAKALIPGGEGLEHGREALDDRRLGQLFWYARQGHGVAFTDYGYADCLSDLQEAARAFGECYVEAWRGWIHVR
ncbi:hypothetical protein RCLKYE_83 [Rhodobacter phage RcLkye]|nr:hypothetical protein RCLKYE_83 [Rhodobacter phage RcLkye]